MLLGINRLAKGAKWGGVSERRQLKEADLDPRIRVRSAHTCFPELLPLCYSLHIHPTLLSLRPLHLHTRPSPTQYAEHESLSFTSTSQSPCRSVSAVLDVTGFGMSRGAVKSRQKSTLTVAPQEAHSLSKRLCFHSHSSSRLRFCLQLLPGFCFCERFGLHLESNRGEQ